MSCYCKQKGKNFEKKVALLIAKAIGVAEEDVRTSKGSSDGPDIQMCSYARAKYPYHTECKNQKRLEVPRWLRQSESECPKDQVPTLVFKLYRTNKIYITLPFEAWLKSIGNAKG